MQNGESVGPEGEEINSVRVPVLSYTSTTPLPSAYNDPNTKPFSPPPVILASFFSKVGLSK